MHTSKDVEVWLTVVEGLEAVLGRWFGLLGFLCGFHQLLTRFGSRLSNLTGNPLSFLCAAFRRFLKKLVSNIKFWTILRINIVINVFLTVCTFVWQDNVLDEYSKLWDNICAVLLNRSSNTSFYWRPLNCMKNIHQGNLEELKGN